MAARGLPSNGASPEGPEELAVTGATGDQDWVNGFYLLDGTHGEKPAYRKQGNAGSNVKIYFHQIDRKWTLGKRFGDVELQHPESSSSPPVGQWNTDSGDPGPTVSAVPQMLCVEGRPSYVRCENFNDRPLYRLAGAQGTLKFDGTGWVVHRSNGTEAARSESAEAVPTLGSWSGGSLQVSVCQLPFPTAPRFIWVEGAGTERVNGCYACTDSYHEKPRYLRVGGEGNIYVDGVWKIGQSNATSGWTYKSHDQAADHAVPPTTRWTKDGPGVDPPPKLYPMQRYSETAPEASSTADSTPSSSEPPFLVVRGAGDDDINGRYACVGSYGGAPKYRKLGGTSIMFYESGLWRLNDEENTNQRLYDGPASRTPLPTSGWILIHDGFREPAPTVSFGNHGDLQVGDEVIIVKNSDRVDWSNCPQSDRLIFLHPPWPLTVDRIEGDWWFSTDFPHKIAPLSALGSAKFNDRQHSISAAGTLRSSATASDTRSDHDAPTRPASGTPFLVVRGAGDARVNGRYACVGTHSDAPKFRKVGGTAIMFYQSGMWRLFHEDDTNKRFYDGPAARTPLPTSGWRALNERVNGVQCAPAPTVSFGSHRDLQTGDRVKVTKRNSETDWSGCPQDDRFQYVGAPDIRTIDRIEGDWWFNTDFPSAISPLAVLGEVRLNDGWHIISAVERTVASATASSSQAPPQQQEQVAEDGFDEEWCPDQDLERFQCCICMLVARNAMVHECGAALFCEMCWVKCQQDSSNCPMCREDGSSIVPAHSDRRLIRNLMIMCPNKCGEKVSLCEKDKHIKTSCKKRQVTCAACDQCYDANMEEEHQHNCPASLVPCRLCGDEVRVCDMEEHFVNNPLKHFHLTLGLLDKVASLEDEVKQLKSRLGEN